MSSPASHDTTTSDLIPPGMSTHEQIGEGAEHQIADLAAFLEQRFPEEISLSNRQVPERVVDTAIRLLESLASTARPEQVTRCPQEFCNKPEHHTDEHGWIHSG